MALEHKTADQPAKRPDVDVFLESRPDLAGDGVREDLTKVAAAVKAALPQLREGRSMTIRLPETPEQVRVARRAYVERLATRLKVNLVCAEPQPKRASLAQSGESQEDAIARLLMEGDEPAEKGEVGPEPKDPMAATLPETNALGQTLGDQPVQPNTSEAAAAILRKYQRRPRT
jgi:hypothetical protein